jgi:hypothetical protein
VSACMAEKVFVYTHGRFPADVDRCALEEVGGRFTAEGAGFPALVRALVESPAFRTRRAPQ